MVLNPELESVGVTPQFASSVNMFNCPKCGKGFSLFQSRAIACRSCRRVNQNCRYVRCIHCDAEFPIMGTVVDTKEKEKMISEYLGGIVKRSNDSFGYSRR